MDRAEVMNVYRPINQVPTTGAILITNPSTQLTTLQMVGLAFLAVGVAYVLLPSPDIAWVR